MESTTNPATALLGMFLLMQLLVLLGLLLGGIYALYCLGRAAAGLDRLATAIEHLVQRQVAAPSGPPPAVPVAATPLAATPPHYPAAAPPDTLNASHDATTNHSTNPSPAPADSSIVNRQSSIEVAAHE